MSFNKFSSIKIGGTDINTITDTYNNTNIISSLNCLGNSIIKGDLINTKDLYLGDEQIITTIIDTIPNYTYTNTGGNIIFKINNITYTLTPLILSYLSSISSNIQTQINPPFPQQPYYTSSVIKSTIKDVKNISLIINICII